MNPFMDMMGTVTRLFQERQMGTERKWTSELKKERERVREMQQLRINTYEYTYPDEVMVRNPGTGESQYEGSALGQSMDYC